MYGLSKSLAHEEKLIRTYFSTLIHHKATFGSLFLNKKQQYLKYTDHIVEF